MMPGFLMNMDVETKNRFDSARFFEWTGTMYDSMDSRFVEDIRAMPAYGNLTITNQAYRPDLLSVDIYGVNGLWNVVKVYNGIIFESQLVEGVTLKYPSLDDLERLYFEYTGMQRSQGSLA